LKAGSLNPESLLSPRLKPGLRVAVFIDGHNVHLSERDLGWEIDFRKLLTIVERMTAGHIYRAFFYAGFVPGHQERFAFFRALRSIPHFELRTKEAHANGGPVIKCNFDVEITVDMLTHATCNAYDVAILLSGDGDLVYAVQEIKRLGCQVICLSTMQGHTGPTAAIALRQVCDQFIDLMDLRAHIEMRRDF